jgi:hypothetical protein
MTTFHRSSMPVGPIRPLLLGPSTLLAVMLGALLAMMGAGQAGKGQDQPARTPGTLVLFDGKTLEGWKPVDFAGAGTVKVEDGAIVMSAGRSMTGITSTHKDLPRANYELSYEAMRLSGHDFFAAATFPVGASYITLVNGGWGGSVTGLSSLDGVDASENDTGQFVKYQDKTWHKFRVRVTDQVIRCWIDEKLIVAVNHQGRRVGTRIEVRRNQPLGFATWETAGALRNVALRALTPAEVAAVNKLEE